MSSPIDKIILRNFKAFFGDYEIDLEGKHLLLYGENGSGKSSIYWSLYTLLQASTKTASEIEKYFDFKEDEHLINRYYIHKQDDTHGSGNYTKDIGKNVEIEAQLQDGEILGISLNGLSAKTNPTILENLNRYSDFITHRLLINFYNFRNSQEIDLWKVFVRDIFPFTYNNLDKGKKTIQELIEELENTQPFKIEKDKIVDLPEGDHYYDYFEKIKYLNIEIGKWVDKISNDANELFIDYFDNKEENFKIDLSFIDRFSYALQPFIIKNNNTEYSVLSKHKFLRTPKIILTISKKRNNGNWETISRPQTYLNEAFITQIALSIRLALTKSRAVNYPGQFLALDDLLISLDMSNRDKVLDIILNEFVGKYKVYLFTHEKSFFNKVKSRLAIKNSIDDWVIKEMYMNTFVKPNSPKVVDNGCYLSQALKHLKKFDLPASANYLRKECEERLKQILPDNIAKKTTEEETKYKQLEDLISSFIKFYKEKLKQKPNDFNKLKEYKDFILNPLSHDNLDAEYYKQELLDAHNLLLTLRKVKKKKLLKVESIFTKKQNNAKGDEVIYTIQAIEELNAFTLLDGSIYIPNINCKVLYTKVGTKKTNLNHQIRFNKLQEVIFKHANNNIASTVPFPPELDVFINSDGITLRQVFND